MADHNKNKLRVIRIYCTRLGSFLFAASFFGLVFLVCYLRNLACSVRETENMIVWGLATLLILQAASWFFCALGGALQDHYTKWQRVGFFILGLSVPCGVTFLQVRLHAQAMAHMETEWVRFKSTIETHFEQHPGQSFSHKSCE